MDAPLPPGRRTQAMILGFVLLASSVVILWHLSRLMAQGGGPFAQGDWLINAASGLVRRGASGEVFLWISDITGLNPVILVGTVQAALILLVVSGLFLAALAAGLPDRLLLLLVSPLCVAFWAIDIGGAFRKEILGYVAFLPLLAKGRAPAAPGIAWLTVALFLIAVAAHEGNIFLLPALIVAIRLRYPGQKLRRVRVRITAALAGIALGGLGFAVAYPFVSDTAAMCAALTTRGVSPGLCTGSIYWTGISLTETHQLIRHLTGGFDRVAVLATFAALLLPVALAYRHAPRPGRVAAIGAALFAGFVPLFFIAADLGRWMSMFLFSVAFITLIQAGTARADWLHRPVHPLVLVLILLMSGTIGVAHHSGLPVRGLLAALVETAFAMANRSA